MKLPCLSIQQPLVEDVFNGCKPVENRSWTWMKNRDWAAQRSVRLGIHASSNRAGWKELTDEERHECCSRSGVEEPAFGCVVGVAELLQICRPHELPRSLRNHDCVNTDPENWCWVLGNPRRFAQPIRAAGQACLFYVEIPDKLLGSRWSAFGLNETGRKPASGIGTAGLDRDIVNSAMKVPFSTPPAPQSPPGIPCPGETGEIRRRCARCNG